MPEIRINLILISTLDDCKIDILFKLGEAIISKGNKIITSCKKIRKIICLRLPRH